MAHDFDTVVDRRQTASNKWQKYPADVLPLWVADMDFPSPRAGGAALRARVEHPFFGYGNEEPEFFEVIVDRLQKRFGWRVSAEAILHLPGVIPGFNLACRSAAAPGDGLLLQTPMYPPILRAPDNCGLTREEAPLGRGRTGATRSTSTSSARPSASGRALFLLCNPHNPVGRVWERPDLSRHRRDLPRAESRGSSSDEIHCDLRLRRTPARADRLARPRDRAPHDHAHGAEQDLQPAGAQVLDRASCPTPRCARGSSPAVDLVRTMNVFGYAATLAAYRDGQPWLDDLLHYLEANRDFLAAVRGATTCPASRWPSPRAPTSRGSTAAARSIPERRPLHVLPRGGEGGAQRRQGVRHAGPGVRAAELRVSARAPHRGAGPHAARAGEPVARAITSQPHSRRAREARIGVSRMPRPT